MMWLLGESILIDEMMMRFKGNHKDKRQITYKAEGSGFQADALCQDGFTYQMYICAMIQIQSNTLVRAFPLCILVQWHCLVF
eukprot:8669945-Ditylum_brightwellii.AAC.1